MTLLDIFFYLFAAILAGMTLRALIHLRSVHRLPSLAETGRLAEPIACSVVFAARDEESRVAETVRHPLAKHFLSAGRSPERKRAA